MSEQDSVSNQMSETEKKAKDDAVAYLKEKGVALEKLAVLFVGSTADAIMGEVDTDRAPHIGFADYSMLIKNPKRILRQTRQEREMMSIEYHLVDLDRINTGTIAIKAMGGFRLEWMDEETKLGYYALLFAYHKTQDMIRQAKESRIVLPQPNFERPNLRDLYSR